MNFTNMTMRATGARSTIKKSAKPKKTDNREIEVRFLDIDRDALVEKLRSLGAHNLGEDFISEIIFYDAAGQWQYKEKKFVRLRKARGEIFLAFKHNQRGTATGTVELEIKVDDFEKTKTLLEAISLVAFREQEKKRHTFQLDSVTVDIDTWPSVPTYVELEGPSEAALKAAAKKLGFNWGAAVFESPRFVIENRYKIPISRLHYFTFQKIE